MFKQIGPVASKALQHSQSNALAKPEEKAPNDVAPAEDPECDVIIPSLVFSAFVPFAARREIIRELTPAERSKIVARRQTLEAALRPFDRDDEAMIDAELAAMLSGFRALRQEREASVAATLTITRHVLRGLPLWAIAQGCMKIARREAGLDDRYAPNDAQIRGVIEEIIVPVRQKLSTMKTLLNAPIEAFDPPKPSKKEFDAQIAEITAKANRERSARGDGGYMARVEADLARRRAEREAKR